MATETIPILSGQQVYQLEHPERRKAIGRIKSAVKNGLLQRPFFCTACLTKDRDIEGHHLDYRFPLMVVWLCRPCHSVMHSKGLAGLPSAPPTSIRLRKGDGQKPLTQVKPRLCLICRNRPQSISTQYVFNVLDYFGKPIGILHQIRHCADCNDEGTERAKKDAAEYISDYLKGYPLDQIVYSKRRIILKVR